VLLGCAALLAFDTAHPADADGVLAPIVVTSTRLGHSPTRSTLQARNGLSRRQAAEADTTQLLQGLPGVSAYSAGGLSALPVIHGLADDRLRVQVNGMDLQAACPNHMNSALSYIAPSDVGEIQVHAGITPVSAGGDSLGGTIQVRSAPPRFAAEGEPTRVEGELGTAWRSNGQALTQHLAASLATAQLHLRFSGTLGQADNYTAARGFKPAASGSENGRVIPQDEVGSTAYKFINQDLTAAWKHDSHLFEIQVGNQHVLFEGFPNQRMDMTGNTNTLVNLHYRAAYDWGGVDARAYTQRTHHVMDMGPDRYQYGTGMPMLTRASTDGLQLSTTLSLAHDGEVKVGTEALRYNLYDWWPPVGGTMGPRAFWNIDNGVRDRLGAYAEWTSKWSPAWTTELGLRHDIVHADASAVQGYDNGLAALWGQDAAAFNARDHAHTDRNWDLTALVRWRTDASQTLELGYARKSRSPSLYQRYPWSTQPMAALMNNFVGDGNGYIGQEDLRPEVAHTLSGSAQWQDAERRTWQARVNAYVTHIDDYIDATRCRTGQCSAANQTATSGFVLLQYINQRARLTGVDASADWQWARSEDGGRWQSAATVSLLRGENTITQAPLYNIMPANARLSLTHQMGAWTSSMEIHGVRGKRQVSGVRNEVPTAGYAVVNVQTRHESRAMLVDLGIDNLFDRAYAQPLGGAYLGQGASMTTQGIPWGVPLPGMGRAYKVAVTLRY
jgi:iron complex outermembrane receptor protein